MPPAELWRPGRDEVRVGGLLSEPADELPPEALVALSEALTAMEGNVDEPVVPVVFDEQPGYYRVSSMRVSPDAVGLAVGWAEWEATLVPVAAGRRPTITSALDQRPRTNSHSISTVACQHAVPAAVDGWSWVPAASPAQQETRQTAPGPAGGDVLCRRAASASGLTTARWWCPPEHYWAGACHVVRRVAVDGRPGLDVPVVGRSVVHGPWRMGNGLVECWLTSSGRLAVRWWLPSGQWSPTTEFVVEQGGGFAFTSWRAVEVTHMSAQQVTVRAQGVRAQGRSTLWLTVRRGSRVVVCTIDTDTVPGHAVRPATPTTVANDGLGHVYLPTGGSGLGWFIAAPDAFGYDLPTGRVTPANALAPTWSWGIGAWVSGEAGDTGSRSQTVRDYYASRTEQVTVG